MGFTLGNTELLPVYTHTYAFDHGERINVADKMSIPDALDFATHYLTDYLTA